MTIELPGFDTVVKNQVYATNKDFPQLFHESLTFLLLLSRYTQPGSKEVFQHLRESVTEIIQNPSKKPNYLEELIRQLPKEVVEGIIKGDGRTKVVKSVKEKIIAPTYGSGEQPNLYLLIQTGTLPQELHQMIKKRGGIFDVYNRALANEEMKFLGFGTMWIMGLLLQDNTLPNKDKLDTLLDDEACKTKTISTTADTYKEGSRVKLVIDAIYSSVLLNGGIDELMDNSKEVINVYVSHSLRRLIENY